MNLIIRNYPRTKMTLTKLIQEDFTKGAQASSLCGEAASVKKLNFQELQQWIQQHPHQDCSKGFM